jgi:Flp pilus assembly protein TadB
LSSRTAHCAGPGASTQSHRGLQRSPTGERTRLPRTDPTSRSGAFPRRETNDQEQEKGGRTIAGVLAVILIAAAVLVWPSPNLARDRLLRLRAAAQADTPGERTAHRDEGRPQGPGVRIWVQAAACGVAGAVGIGGVLGLAAGAAVAAAVVVLARRREPVEARRRRERLIADLPFAAEMLAACLRAGQPTRAAVEAVAEAMGGPLGEILAAVGRRLMLGADPEEAWAVAAAEPALAPLARAMTRAALSGAPVADVLTRLSADARQEARALSAAAARKVGVLAVAPLGLCFLPAFVCLGIVPVVVALASQVLVP